MSQDRGFTRSLAQRAEAAGCRASFNAHQLVLSGFRGEVDWVGAVLRAMAWMAKFLPR